MGRSEPGSHAAEPCGLGVCLWDGQAAGLANAPDGFAGVKPAAIRSAAAIMPERPTP